MIRKGKLQASRCNDGFGRWHYEIKYVDLDPDIVATPTEMTPADVLAYYGDNDGKPYSEKDLLSPAQVAKLWGKSRITIYRHIKDGILPATKDSHGHYKILRDDIPGLWQCPPGIQTVEEKARSERDAKKSMKSHKARVASLSPEILRRIRKNLSSLRSVGCTDMTDEKIESLINDWGELADYGSLHRFEGHDCPLCRGRR